MVRESVHCHVFFPLLARDARIPRGGSRSYPVRPDCSGYVARRARGQRRANRAFWLFLEATPLAAEPFTPSLAEIAFASVMPLRRRLGKLCKHRKSLGICPGTGTPLGNREGKTENTFPGERKVLPLCQDPAGRFAINSRFQSGSGRINSERFMWESIFLSLPPGT